METEFTIFRVKKGKEKRAGEWMEMLVARRNDCVATLEREAMYYETIFQTKFQDRMYLAWFSVQGDIHGDVNESMHEIDKLHCAFFEECLEIEAWRPIDMEHVVTFAPSEIEKHIVNLDLQSQSNLSRNATGK